MKGKATPFVDFLRLFPLSRSKPMSTLRGNWNYPTSIRFGAGRIAELPDACQHAGHRKPLLVTDPGLAALPMIANAVELVPQTRARRAKCSPTCRPIRSKPTSPQASQLYRRGGYDGVIAFGGGSALDTGKAIALMVGQTRPIWDFEDREDWYTRVNVAGMAPTVAVPTTSGTGSEVGRASVITDVRDHTKKIIFHPRMQPALVIADPELTVGSAAARHRGGRHGRAVAQSRSVLLAVLSPDGRRHRARRHAADQGMAAARRARRREHRSARAHDGRLHRWARRRSRKGSARCTA